jgi:hypothetical protein
VLTAKERKVRFRDGQGGEVATEVCARYNKRETGYEDAYAVKSFYWDARDLIIQSGRYEEIYWPPNQGAYFAERIFEWTCHCRPHPRVPHRLRHRR